MRLLCSSETYIYTVFPLDDLKTENILFEKRPNSKQYERKLSLYRVF